ncbi:MAG: DUF4157 domain-containing protein [Dokdonella sp.]
MTTFAQKQIRPKKQSSSSVTRSSTATAGLNHHANSQQHSQSTIEQRMLQTGAHEREGSSTGTGASRFAHDFSRVPVHASAARTIQPTLWRTCACGVGCSRCQMHEHQRLQTQRVDSTESGQTVAPPIVEEALARGGGSLPDELRDDMGRRFAHDFSNVRLHTHAHAADSAAAVGARAYTVGSDVVFADGEYAPQTAAGRRLIAHELAHVVQQHGTHASNARAGIAIGPANDPLEQEAEAAAQRAIAGADPGIAGTSLSGGLSRLARAPLLQREPGPDNKKKEEAPLARVPYRDKPATPAHEKLSQEDGVEKGPQLVTASVARPTCAPKGMARKDYLAQPHTSTDDFGLTRFAGQVRMALKTRKVKGGVALEPLQVALPPITSVFTTTDTFIEGTGIFLSQDHADCPDAKPPLQWRIFPGGAAKIREGETEHCDDLQYAYDVTFGWYGEVVDGLIAKGTTFPNEPAAFKHLKKLTGEDPTSWPAVFACLIHKTELRDGKKFSNGWHTPRVKAQPPRLDDNCKFSRVTITGAPNFPELGKHPTPSVITGCGESANAVKAVAAKVTAAKAAASGQDHEEGKTNELPSKTPDLPSKSTEPRR